MKNAHSKILEIISEVEDQVSSFTGIKLFGAKCQLTHFKERIDLLSLEFLRECHRELSSNKTKPTSFFINEENKELRKGKLAVINAIGGKIKNINKSL